MINTKVISIKKNILGEIESLKIRAVQTGEIKTITADQAKWAIEQGKIKIKRVCLSKAGNLYELPKSKKTCDPNVKKLKALLRKYYELQNLVSVEDTIENKKKFYTSKKKLDDFLELHPEYEKKFEAMQAKLDRGKKI